MTGQEILVLNAGQHLCRTICWALEYKGYQVSLATTPDAAIEALVRKNYDLVIAKLTMEGGESLEVLKKAKKLNPEVKVMLIGDHNHLTFPPEAYKIEVDDYLLMPFRPTELWRRVSRCLEEVVDLKAANPSAARQATEIYHPVSNRVMLALHDIRGSMVATAASLKLLIRGTYGEASPQVAEKLQELYDKVKNSTDLADEFMDAARSANDQTESQEDVLDLRQDVIKPVLEELAPEIRGQQITIENRLDSFPTDLISVKGNKLILKSVFRNLLNNGIKYGVQVAVL